MEKAVNTIYNQDCRQGLKEISDNSIDACVTDPPWGIRFMGKIWDYEIPPVEIWEQVLRVLKPGAHLLCACGTRTQHRMAVNIEDAGFEIRDVVCWHYGQGFPKSLDVGKALDKVAGMERDKFPNPKARQQTGAYKTNAYGDFKGASHIGPIPVTEAGRQWDGWGTALKPATEFWTLARKPLSEKTVANNVIKYGTGSLNIDGCRIETADVITNHSRGALSAQSKGIYADSKVQSTHQTPGQQLGRFPANVILDEFMAGEMDSQTGLLKSGKPSGVRKAKNNVYGQFAAGGEISGYGDTGGASRFFYVAKANVQERGPGNNHPTVKPVRLLQYLIKLICPLEVGRIVLDPFAGSGTTCIAARQLQLDFIAFELEAGHIRIAESRLRNELGLSY